MIKQGDIVKILGTKTAWLRETIGEVGIVKRIEAPRGEYPENILVEFTCDYSDDNRWYYSAKELKVITC